MDEHTQRISEPPSHRFGPAGGSGGNENGVAGPPIGSGRGELIKVTAYFATSRLRKAVERPEPALAPLPPT